MPHRWSRLVALGGLACMFAVSGCVGAEPGEPSPSPTDSSEPVFASEEEALAAATEVYEQYLRVANEVAADGGTGVNRFAPFVTEEALAEEDESYSVFRDEQLVSSGSATYDNLRLQDYRPELQVGDSLNLYVCYDVTQVRLINATGLDVTPSDRTNRLPLQISVLVNPDEEIPLRIDKSDVWSGENFC